MTQDTMTKRTKPVASTAKTAAKKKPATGGAPAIEHHKRQEMIAEAAYFRAESNGFMGDPRDHWLEAEQAIDAMLCDQAVSAAVEG